MVLSGGVIAAVLGVIGALGAAAIAGFVALRSAKNNADATRRAAELAAKQSGFEQSLDLTKYVRDQVKAAVDEETADLRQKVQNLERLVESLHGKYTMIRDAFRDYVRAVLTKFGPAEAPLLDGRIRSLLDEHGEDTITGQMLAQLRDSIQNEDEGPPL